MDYKQQVKLRTIVGITVLMVGIILWILAMLPWFSGFFVEEISTFNAFCTIFTFGTGLFLVTWLARKLDNLIKKKLHKIEADYELGRKEQK